MKFRPSLYQTSLPPRKFTSNQFDGIQAHDGHVVLIVSMKVRQVVWYPNLHIHANDNTMKSTEFRHGVILSLWQSCAYQNDRY